MRNNIYCFFEHHDTVFSEESKELIQYWKKTWSNNGWNPIVLEKDIIDKHPLYFALRFENFEESNIRQYCASHKNINYIRSCFMRWLAYYCVLESQDAIFWADYDVINYEFTYEKYSNIPCNSVFINDYSSGKINKTGIKYIINTFLDIEYNKNNIEHLSNFPVSDMVILNKLINFRIHKEEDFLSHTIRTHWKKSPMVHYDNGIFQIKKDLLFLKNKKLTRLEAIKKLESIRSGEK